MSWDRVYLIPVLQQFFIAKPHYFLFHKYDDFTVAQNIDECFFEEKKTHRKLISLK